MTTKDYKVIAKCVGESYSETWNEYADDAKALTASRTAIANLAARLMFEMQTDNPKFDKEKFIEYSKTFIK
jgi:hypothetical protein